jgi:hypothetical protein
MLELGSQGVTYRRFRADDKQYVLGLLTRGWPSAQRRSKERVFDWRYVRNPHDDGREPFLVAEVAAGRPVAINGIVPARVRFDGARLHACWNCDTFVAPEMRGLGVEDELVRRVAHAAPLLLTLGRAEASGRPVTRMLFHVKERGFFGGVKNALCKIVGVQAFAMHMRRCDISTGPDASISSEIDELWRFCSKGYMRAVERDAAYLRWKFGERPEVTYQWYLLRNRQQLEGVLIARHDPEESVIVDYCGPAEDMDLMVEIATHAVSDLTSRRTTRIRCDTTHPPMISALRRVGFARSRSDTALRVRANIKAGDGDPHAGWFVMTGDCDVG